MVLVITNAYKGVLVSGLTAPLPTIGTWNNVKYMSGFNFCTYDSEELYYSLHSTLMLDKKRSRTVQVMFGYILEDCLTPERSTNIWCKKDNQEFQINPALVTNMSTIMTIGNVNGFSQNSTLLTTGYEDDYPALYFKCTSR